MFKVHGTVEGSLSCLHCMVPARVLYRVYSAWYCQEFSTVFTVHGTIEGSSTCLKCMVPSKVLYRAYSAWYR